MIMEFFLYLPSNGCQKYYPNNTISSFKTKIPNRINFRVPYEVGLAEFTYVRSMKTFSDPEDLKFSLHLVKDEQTLEEYEVVQTKITEIRDCHYGSIQQLIDSISNAIKSAGPFTIQDGNNMPKNINTAEIKYDKRTNRVIFNTSARVLFMMSQKLATILGFDDHIQIETHGKDTVGLNAPDILGGMHHIFVYCDIIERQVVGDSYVPLLRMVNIKGAEGAAVTETIRPYYLPVCISDFDTISIELCSEYGEKIPFDYGQSTVVLHFRPISGHQQPSINSL